MPTVNQDILQELQKLHAEHEALVRQRCALDAAIARVMARIPGHDPGSWMGSLKDHKIDLTYEDFKNARREAWAMSGDKPRAEEVPLGTPALKGGASQE